MQGFSLHDRTNGSRHFFNAFVLKDDKKDKIGSPTV